VANSYLLSGGAIWTGDPDLVQVGTRDGVDDFTAGASELIPR
jgi:hypothetical protein